MALKADRMIDAGGYDVSYFCNQVLERGRIVVHNQSGSGAAMDMSTANVTTPTGLATPTSSPVGTKPVGLLLGDVVSVDLTRTHWNWHRDEVPSGGKVPIMRQGWVLTNLIVGTPVAGNPTYYDGNGYVTPTNVGSPTVGRFLSAKDADGYAKVYINITGN